MVSFKMDSVTTIVGVRTVWPSELAAPGPAREDVADLAAAQSPRPPTASATAGMAYGIHLGPHPAQVTADAGVLRVT